MSAIQSVSNTGIVYGGYFPEKSKVLLETFELFDYSLAHWITFVSAAALLSLSPGPDMAYILAHAAKGGRRAGFAAMLGIWTGAFVHVLFAAVGLSALLATSAVAFSVVKWLGAGYLIFVGIRTFLHHGGAGQPVARVKDSTVVGIYVQGVLISTLNPKVALFFVAFLPQFVVPGAGPVGAQLFLHGCLVIVVAAFIEPPLVILGSRIGNLINTSPKISVYIDRCLGALLVGLGIKLALTQRQ